MYSTIVFMHRWQWQAAIHAQQNTQKEFLEKQRASLKLRQPVASLRWQPGRLAEYKTRWLSGPASRRGWRQGLFLKTPFDRSQPDTQFCAVFRIAKVVAQHDKAVKFR